MTQQPVPPQRYVKESHDLIEQTAARLHEMIVGMAGSLVPFPYFLGSTEVQAIEAEPGGLHKADRGCIVVCADGEMYELTVKMADPGGMGFGMDRTDSVKPIELPPEEYIVYASHAIKELAILLREQEGRARKYSF